MLNESSIVRTVRSTSGPAAGPSSPRPVRAPRAAERCRRACGRPCASLERPRRRPRAEPARGSGAHHDYAEALIWLDKAVAQGVGYEPLGGFSMRGDWEYHRAMRWPGSSKPLVTS